MYPTNPAKPNVTQNGQPPKGEPSRFSSNLRRFCNVLALGTLTAAPDVFSQDKSATPPANGFEPTTKMLERWEPSPALLGSMTSGTFDTISEFGKNLGLGPLSSRPGFQGTVSFQGGPAEVLDGGKPGQGVGFTRGRWEVSYTTDSGNWAFVTEHLGDHIHGLDVPVSISLYATAPDGSKIPLGPPIVVTPEVTQANSRTLFGAGTGPASEFPGIFIVFGIWSSFNNTSEPHSKTLDPFGELGGGVAASIPFPNCKVEFLVASTSDNSLRADVNVDYRVFGGYLVGTLLGGVRYGRVNGDNGIGGSAQLGVNFSRLWSEHPKFNIIGGVSFSYFDDYWEQSSSPSTPALPPGIEAEAKALEPKKLFGPYLEVQYKF